MRQDRQALRLPQALAPFVVTWIPATMEIGSRRIARVNLTSNPAVSCAKQQIHDAAARDQTR